ncbi:HAMP domain-containing protein [Skermanella rosea]|uniref:HAMP domain-containing protein n=1 Tax=Skermanella rosea TaxID=1817965 RepID=UPI00389994A1
MTALAGGDVHAPIPATHRRDEIGRMASAVVTFRDNAICPCWRPPRPPWPPRRRWSTGPPTATATCREPRRSRPTGSAPTSRPSPRRWNSSPPRSGRSPPAR